MLNKSTGNMYDFISHTWNIIKGECYHDCSYCHPKGTMIMLSDFTQKPIEDIIIGDKIIGLKKDNGIGFYKFTKTKVVDTSTRMDKVLKITTKDWFLECTPDHPLMGSTEKRNCSDWKAAKAFSPYENLRFISKNHRGAYSYELRLGYIKGVIDGDGCIFKFYNKEKREYNGFEMVCVDLPLRDRVISEFKKMLSIDLRIGIKRANKDSYGGDCEMIHTRKNKDVLKLKYSTEFRLNKEFAKGYIAGMIDTDGSVSKGGCIRISQSRKVNRIKYDRILKCLEILNMDCVEEKDIIRINTTFEKRIDILFNYGVFHSIKSERLFLGMTIKGSIHSQIKTIEATGQQKVYNLQTESENFIANGFIVHNCYMKRWGKLNPVRFDEKELKTDLGKDNFIFVGSSNDMFSPAISYEWMVKILAKCREFDNKYFFQSKNTFGFKSFLDQNLFPKNSVFCTTIETNRFYAAYMGNTPKPVDRAFYLPVNNYITIEPIMDFDLADFVAILKICKPTQINIGSDSGNNNLPEPPKEKIIELITELQKFTKVKLKSNLKRLVKHVL